MFSKLLIALGFKKKPQPMPSLTEALIPRRFAGNVPPRPLPAVTPRSTTTERTAAAAAPAPHRRDDDSAPSPSPAYEQWNSAQPSWATPMAVGATAAVFASGHGGDFGGAGAGACWDAPSPSCGSDSSYSSDSGSCSGSD
jgi:hypothetical protein